MLASVVTVTSVGIGAFVIVVPLGVIVGYLIIVRYVVIVYSAVIGSIQQSVEK